MAVVVLAAVSVKALPMMWNNPALVLRPRYLLLRYPIYIILCNMYCLKRIAKGIGLYLYCIVYIIYIKCINPGYKYIKGGGGSPPTFVRTRF